MTHRRSALRSILMTSALAIAAAGFQQATPAWAGGDSEIIVAVTKLTVHLDPMGSNSNVNERVSNNLVETLLNYDLATGEMTAGLAESWGVDETTGTLSMTIRQGVKCHNGEDFNAEDVEYMFGPARYNSEDAPGYGNAVQYLGGIKEVKATGSHTVDIIPKGPDPLIALRFASWMGQVPCADAYKAAGSWESWGQSVVGTGPYKLVGFKAGEFQKFERFDDYWGDKAPLKSFTLTVVPEMAGRVAGLFTGEFDIITEIGPDQFDTINGNDGTEIAGGPINNIRIIPYDTRHPALQDPRVRQAMNMAIDRQLIVDSLYGGRTVVPNGMQMKRFGEMYIGGHAGAKFDPEGARKLLKEAGYNGEEISYRYLQDYYTNEVSTAQVLASMWKDVGLNVKLELMENWSQIEDATADEGRGVINWSSTAVYPDPIGQILRMFGPNGFFQRNDFWKNDKFNELGDVLMTTDHAARRDALAQMLEIYEKDPPATYLHVLPMFYGKQSAIDWTPSGTAFMDMRAGSISID